MIISRILRAKAVLLLLLALSFSTIAAKAEGSIQVNPRGVGATRAYLEHKENGKFTGGIARTNRILFIAKRGETVALASSVDKSYMDEPVDIIVKYLQDGRSWSIDVKGEHDGAATPDKYEGYIAKPINEVAGPWYPMVGEQGNKYKPYLFKVPYEGVYEVEFIGKDKPISSGNQNSPADPVEADWADNTQYENVAAWDISVFDVNDKLVNGRVFASYLALIIGNGTGKHFSNLYVLTQDGYQYSMNIQGIQPAGFILYADNVGLIDDGNGQTLNRNGVSSSNKDIVPIGGVVTVHPDLDAKDDILTHRIFFNEPDPNIEFMHGGFPVSPQPIASIVNCNFIGNTNQEDKYGNADESMGGVFSVELDRRSTYEIIIDCDNDGKFNNNINNSGYSDRVLTAAGCVGVNYLSWNGLDGNGKPLPIGEYAIQVRTHAGDFHFPMGDVEYNPEGIEIKLLNALAYQSTGKDDDKQYRAWYDARKYTTHNKTIVNPEGTNAPKPSYIDMDYSTDDDISKGGFMKYKQINTADKGYGDMKIVDIWSYVVNDGRSVTQSTITLSPKGSNNYAFISGTTYFEKTRNGKYDNGERGVDGVILTLCDASKNPVLRDGQPITVKSNNGGRFAFDNIPFVETGTTYWIKVDKGMDNGEVYSLTETTIQKSNYRKVAVNRFDNFKIDIFGWGGNDVSVKAAIDQISIYTGYEQTLTVTLKNEVKDAKVNNVVVTIDQSQLTAETILEGNISYEIVGAELEDETFANGIWTVPTMSAGETRKLILKFTPIKEAASVTHEVRAHINSNNNVETNKTNNEASVTYEVIKSTAGSIVYKANNGGTGEDFVVNIKTIQKPGGTNAVLKSLKDTGIEAKGCMTFLGWGVNDPLKVTNVAGDNIKESLVGAALPVYAIWQGNKTKYRVRHLEILSDGTKTDSEVKDEDVYDDKRVGDVVVVEQSLIPGYQYITKDEPLTLECEGDNIYNIYYQFNTVLPVAVKDLVYDGTAHELITEITPEEGVTFKYSLDGGGYTTALPKATNAGDHVVKLQVFSASRKVHEVEFTVTIAPKELTLTWEGSSFTYNSKPQAPVATLTGIIGTDDVKAVVSGAQTNVGTGYEATVTLDGKKASNYKLPDEVTTTFDIIAADPVLTAAPAANTLTYNATAQDLVAEGHATGGKLMYSTDGTSWTETIPQGTEAKIYTLYYKIAGDANHNSTEMSEPINVAISPKTIDVVWGVTNFDYDELPHTPTATLSGVETIDNSFVSLSVAGSGTSVGNYTATATLQGAKANNYQLSVATSTTSFSIGKSAPIVTSPTAATSLVYNGANQALLATAGSTNGGTLKYSIDGKNWTTDVPQAKSAQEYTIYYKVEGDANHSDVATKTLNAVIEQKLLTVDWGTRTFEYDGNPHKPTPLLSGVVTGDQVVITANGEKTAVGTYPSQATLSGNDAANYKLASGADQTTFDITKAAVTVSAPTAETLTYNGKKQNLVLAATTSAGTVEYSINNGTSWSETIPAATDAGLYSVYYRVNGGNNYDDIAKSGPVEVTIAQKELTLTWGSTTTFTYDGTPKKPSLEFAGKIGTDDVTVTVSGAQTSKGNYTAKAILEGSASANYKLPANVTLDFSISGATPAVTAPAANHLTYNGANQELVTPGSCSTGTIYYSTNGIDGWTEIVPKGKNAGSDYEVYYKVESTDDNYSGVDPTGPIAVTIARKTIGIEWSNTTFVYDGNPHKPTATATGKEGTDNVTIVVTGEETESGSDYVATAVSIEGADIANYEMPTSGLTTTFSIGRKPIAKPAIDLTQSFVYTGAEHTFSVPGPSDASGYTITGNRETNAGTYTVVVKLGDNFSWSDGSRDDINHEWSIARAEVTLPSAVTSTFTYDGTVKVLEVTENDKYTIGSEYATVTNAGTYNRVVSLNDKSNYVWTDGTDASKTITFTVDKAKVDLPTAPTTNFIFDGTEKTFTVNPNANYTVDPANASATKIGSYPRTVSLNDADNYEWIDGTVAPKTIEFKIGTGTIDEPTIQLEYTYTGSTIVFLTGSEYEIINGEGKDAGTYSMKVTPQHGYTWAGGSVEPKTYDVVILPAKVDKPTFVQTEYIWNGSEFNFNVPQNDCYTITGETKATEIADYPVSITLMPNYIWSDGTSEAINETFKIKPIVVNVPAADETEFTYDGNEKTYTLPENEAYVIVNNRQTNAGKYTVSVSLNDDVHYVWNDNSNGTQTYGFTIAQIMVPVPVPEHTTFIFDGGVKTFAIPQDEQGRYTVGDENATGSLVNTYYRKVTLKDAVNYAWEDGFAEATRTIAFVITTGSVDVPAVEKEHTYTGLPITLVPADDAYIVTGGVQTDAGEYDVILTLVEGYTWTGGTADPATIHVVINPAQVSKPDVTVTEFTYDGTDIYFNIVERSGYTIEGPTQGLEPDEYVVNVTPKSNYVWSDGSGAGTVTYKFYINKIQIDVPANDETAFTYNGGEHTFYIPTNGAYTVSGNVQTDAGQHTVTVSLNDIAHYVWTDGSSDDKTYEFNIAKATVAIPVAPQTTFIYDGAEKRFDIPEGAGYVVDSKNATGVELKSYDRVVSLKDKKNTLWSDGTSDDIVITFVIGDGTIELPVVGEFTYTGSPIVLIPEKVEYSVEGGVQTDAGIYDVKLTPTTGFKWSDGTSDSKVVAVTINPAKVDKPNVPSISYPYDGESHGIKIAENVAYVISGDTEAIKPGTYTVTVTLNNNYIWSDNTDAAQTYTFVIEDIDEPESNRLDASLIKLMWNDVLVVDNSDSRFTSYQWYRNGEIINGANEQFYCEKGGVNGSYEVVVKSVDGQEYIIGPAVFMLESIAFNITVNPNPIHTGETFSVVVEGLSESEMQNAVVRIYTISSAVVFSSDKVEHINQVILSSRGAHVVSVVSGSKKAAVKILVE